MTALADYKLQNPGRFAPVISPGDELASLFMGGVWDGTKTRQAKIVCCGEISVGEKSILRIKRKDEKWVAAVTTALPDVYEEVGHI